jgi:hypothetical protein
MSTSESIIRELVDEHGINSVAVPCPYCLRRLNSSSCSVCQGTGKIQYGINDVELLG